MTASVHAHETQQVLYDYIKAANLLIPSLKIDYIRLSQMNFLLHRFMKNMKNSDILFDAQEIQLHAGMDHELIDTLSSIKLLLSAIQKEIDSLYNRCIHVKSLDKGIFGITVPNTKNTGQLLWQVGDKEILYWEEHDGSGNFSKRPILELYNNKGAANQ